LIKLNKKALIERRNAARRNFKQTVKAIASGIDLHLSPEGLSPGTRKVYQRVRTALSISALRFVSAVDRLTDQEAQSTLFRDAVMPVVAALLVGHHSGRKSVAALISKIESKNTSKAVAKSAENKQPMKRAKERITIACAKIFMTTASVRPRTTGLIPLTQVSLHLVS
jgi:hypothetical protein